MLKRLVILSDLHCGHRLGLTPPDWQTTDIQRKLFDAFYTQLESLKPIHAVLGNGDMIDGRGKRSSGVELITTDRLEQAAMASECLLAASADHYVITAGTPYHTGKCEDFEREVAKHVNGQFCDMARIDINGCLIHARHKADGSSTPYGQHTPLSKSALWHALECGRYRKQCSDIVIRSHTHKFVYGNCVTGSLFMSTPCLQLNSRYGARQCEGLIDVGFVHFDIEEDGSWSWGAKLLDVRYDAELSVQL